MELLNYLKDICFLESAYEVWSAEYEKQRAKLQMVDRYIYEPAYPQKPSVKYWDIVLLPVLILAIICLIGFIILLVFLIVKMTNYCVIILLIGAPISLICLGPVCLLGEKIVDCRKDREEQMERYRSLLNGYEDSVNELKKKKEWAADLTKRLALLDNDILEIRVTLGLLYEQNIIPASYRCAEAALFLYDWFSANSASDLAYVLTLYAKEADRCREIGREFYKLCDYKRAYDQLRYHVSSDVMEMMHSLSYK